MTTPGVDGSAPLPAGRIGLRRRLPATVDEVFRWWTEAACLREWMTPAGTVEAQVDLRVGGSFRIVMMARETVIEHTGRYLEIDRPRRLVFSWVSPYTGTVPSLVTVELAPAGAATELTLVHEHLPASASGAHAGGWSSMLDRLAGRLRSGVG